MTGFRILGTLFRAGYLPCYYVFTCGYLVLIVGGTYDLTLSLLPVLDELKYRFCQEECAEDEL